MSDSKCDAKECPLDEAMGEAEWLEKFHLESKRGLAIYRELERLTTQTRLLRTWLKDAAACAGVRWDSVVRINASLQYEHTKDGQPITATLTLADLPLPMALVMRVVVLVSAYMTDAARQLAAGMDELEELVQKVSPHFVKVTGRAPDGPSN